MKPGAPRSFGAQLKTLREAAGNLSVGEAARYIERGDADLMVAGATGTRVHPMKAVHASRQEDVAANGVAPEQASRPFDLRRTGMVLGEGAGVLVLESLESAQARGAVVYAEVIGSSSSKRWSGRRWCDRMLARSTSAATAKFHAAQKKFTMNGSSDRPCS